MRHNNHNYYHNDLTFLDRHICANSVDQDQTEGAVWSGSSLFAISSLYRFYLTTSPSRTRRLLLTHLFILILSSVTVSSERTIHTVSFLRFPFSNTVSPRNNCNSSIFFWKCIKCRFWTSHYNFEHWSKLDNLNLSEEWLIVQFSFLSASLQFPWDHVHYYTMRHFWRNIGKNLVLGGQKCFQEGTIFSGLVRLTANSIFSDWSAFLLFLFEVLLLFYLWQRNHWVVFINGLLHKKSVWPILRLEDGRGKILSERERKKKDLFFYIIDMPDKYVTVWIIKCTNYCVCLYKVCT